MSVLPWTMSTQASGKPDNIKDSDNRKQCLAAQHFRALTWGIRVNPLASVPREGEALYTTASKYVSISNLYLKLSIYFGIGICRITTPKLLI